jgi:hypothetical protein
MENFPSLSAASHSPVPGRKEHRAMTVIKGFLCGGRSCYSGSSKPGNDFLTSSMGNLSSVTTANGPWIYTIVPWED